MFLRTKSQSQTNWTFQLCQATLKLFCLRCSQNHTLLSFFQLLSQKDIDFQPNIILGVVLLHLPFFRATDLPIDKAEIGEAFAFVNLACNIFISKHKNHSWNYMNLFYIDSQNINGDNRVRCQNMKISTFLTYCLSVCKNPSQTMPRNCLQNCQSASAKTVLGATLTI